MTEKCEHCKRELPRVPFTVLRHDYNGKMATELRIEKQFCSIDCLLIWALGYFIETTQKRNEL